MRPVVGGVEAAEGPAEADICLDGVPVGVAESDLGGGGAGCFARPGMVTLRKYGNGPPASRVDWEGA